MIASCAPIRPWRRLSLTTRGPVLTEETIVVPATPEELAAIHAALDRFWGAVEVALAQPPNQDWRHRFAIAVVEVATNIARHAYPAGTAQGPMQLRLRSYADRAVACFADRGVAFVGPAEAGGSFEVDPSELPEGGFGLALIRACLDRLAYRRTPQGTNCWRLVKRY